MLQLGEHTFKSHLLLGTGKFASNALMRAAVEAAATELVTVALKRIDAHDPHDDLLAHLQIPGIKILPNTSGVRNAREAVFASQMAREALHTNLIKLEIHPDPRYLLPDGEETLLATRELAKDGFVVLPYIQADPVLCKKLEEAGAAAVMPLGAPIGSNQGLLTKEFLRIIIEQSSVPVIVDAGLGVPSHACEALEMGADAVLVNTAIAVADDPVGMAKAFRLAVESGLTARASGAAPVTLRAQASSPLTSFLDHLLQ